ncbi:11 kDa late embryogenesis abundant protein-like [Dendrobium catenatum]|uniref:18 kDa seed maturation protein n=1 Tax=Dendrobium catenatum TaxID=906689 RepID=A0A2I0VJV9_9ASPA|nr:11 kDa late embryogenesis abundant protein-like [Dendrobium catenatum]PKU63653.1 18 kDa seed maturation protein [Dendrobium catenatum]
MEAGKEKVLNIGATAKAGMDKTKATAEEKIERMKTRDPLQKEVAEGRKLEKIHQAELAKQQAYKENAIQKGEGEGEAHHIGAGHQTGLVGHHAGVGHQTGLGGHRTAVGHKTGLDEPTNGGTGFHRTDAPIADTKIIQTVQETGGGLY